MDTATNEANDAQHTNLKCLNGPRALSSIWVAVFHVYTIFLAFGSEKEMISKYERQLWPFRLIINGMLAIDVFFVITGMLAAYHLIPQLRGLATPKSQPTATMRSVLSNYYRRRVVRLLPLYAVGLALAVMVAIHSRRAPGTQAHIIYRNWFAGCPQLLWKHVLFINNRGIPTGCGVAYWTMAVSLQFYIIFPLFLCLLQPATSNSSFPARLGWALGVTIAASTAFRLRDALRASPTFPIGFTISHPFGIYPLFSWLKHVYYPSTGRATALLVGAALGAALASPAALAKLRRARQLVSMLSYLLVGAAAWAASQPWHGHEAPWSRNWAVAYGAFMHSGSLLVSAAIALFFLAMAIAADPLHAAAANFFSLPIFCKLADLSLGMFIFHTQAYYAVLAGLEKYAWWPGLIAQRPMAAMGLAAVGTVAGAYAATMVYNLLCSIFVRSAVKSKAA